MRTNGQWDDTNYSPLDLVENFLRRFVVYPSEHDLVAHVLWLAHAHLMDCWDSTPRLGFVSAQPASGKTRALEVSELFVPQPKLSASMSPAAMVRIIAKARKEDRFVTVLYDELDVALSKGEEGTADLRSALNAGYRRNGVFTRCINSGADTADFPCYAALAFAGLKAEGLPDALATRTIFIHMKPRANDEPKEDFELDWHPDQALPIFEALALWCEANKGAMRSRPNRMPVRDRAADIWKPLIAIADIAGGEWSKRAREAAIHLTGAGKAAVKSGSDTELLRDIRTAFFDEARVHGDELVRRLRTREESPWDDKYKPLTPAILANRLKPYGIESKQMKLNGANRRGYERADFEDAWKRYAPLPEEGATCATPATNLSNKDKKVAEVAEVAPWETEDATNAAAEPGSFDPDFDGLRDMPEGLRRQQGAP